MFEVINLDNIRCPLCSSSEVDIIPVNRFHLRKCLKCTMVFSPEICENSAKTENDEKDVYYAGNDSNLTRPSAGEWNSLRWGQRFFLRKYNKGRLLDIGCGTGNFIAACERTGLYAIGHDASYKAMEIAEKNGREIAYDIDTISIPFDFVTLWEALEHMNNPLSIMKKAVSLIDESGYLALSTPNWNHRAVNSTDLSRYWPPFHVTFWTKETLTHLFRMLGLKIVKLKYRPLNLHVSNQGESELAGYLKSIIHEASIIGMEILIIGQKGK